MRPAAGITAITNHEGFTEFLPELKAKFFFSLFISFPPNVLMQNVCITYVLLYIFYDL